MRKLKRALEAHQESSLPVTPQDDSPRRPVPPFTQFLREQYEAFRSKDVSKCVGSDLQVKLPFIECSKRISKMWRTMSEESKKPYLVCFFGFLVDEQDRFRREMEEFNKKRQNSVSQLPHNLDNSDRTFICRQ